MALPLVFGICLMTGVACFLTHRATKAANEFTHGHNVNSRPPAPATSSNKFKPGPPAAPATSSNKFKPGPPVAPATFSNNLNQPPPAAPATSSDNLNHRPLPPATSSNNLNQPPPAAPATSSDNLNRRPLPPATSSNQPPPAAPDTSSDNLNRQPLPPATSSYNLAPPAPATSSDNDLNRRSPAAPATSPDNLNRLPLAPVTLSDNLNSRPRALAISSNNPVMHDGDMAAELAKYEVCPLFHSTGAVGAVEVHLRTNIVEEVKINELRNGLVEGLENNEVFKGCLGDGLGAVTSVVDLELDDNIDLITPLIEEADDFKSEEEAVNLSGDVLGSGEGWWVTARKRVDEWFRWVKGRVKRRAEWAIDEADVGKHEEEAANLRGSVIGSGEGWWVTVKRWVEERFRWVKGKLKPWAELSYLDVGMRLMLMRLMWVVVDSIAEDVIGRNRVLRSWRLRLFSLLRIILLKSYKILINELRCRW